MDCTNWLDCTLKICSGPDPRQIGHWVIGMRRLFGDEWGMNVEEIRYIVELYRIYTRSSREEGELRMSWESRIFLMKAGRSMEPVRRNELVGGGGRTRGLISRSAMMRKGSVMLK